MGRPRKNRQTFNFPRADQEIPSAAELDAEIDGNAVTQTDEPAKAPAAETLRRNADAKKKTVAALKEIPQIFEPDQVVWVFDVYVGVLCFLFSVVLKCNYQPLYEELSLPDEVKQAWAKPLARIASKYAPAEWAGMTAEIELICGMGLWSVTAFGRARTVAKLETAKKAEAAGVRHRAPTQTTVVCGALSACGQRR